MANGLKITGLSGDVSSVSIQSNRSVTWALLGRKWAGLRWKVHQLSLHRDELLVLKCHGGNAVLKLEATQNDHGDTIVHGDCLTVHLNSRRGARVVLHQGQAVCIKTADMTVPWGRHGPIIET